MRKIDRRALEGMDFQDLKRFVKSLSLTRLTMWLERQMTLAGFDVNAIDGMISASPQEKVDWMIDEILDPHLLYLAQRRRRSPR